MVTSRFVRIFFCLTLASLTQPCAAETVLLDFSSPSCGPCQQMRPVVSRLAASGYRVQEINIQSEPQVAARFKVSQVPTFIVLVDGREASRSVGLTSYEQLQQMLTSQPSPPAMRRQVPQGQSPDTFAIPPARQVAPRPPTLPTGSAVEPGLANGNKRLIEATVKIAVQDPEGTSAGTGTIIDTRSGEALVLTCGHLFRESAGKGPITVTLFQAGPAGAEIRTTAPGRLIDFDLERDLALVSLRTEVPIEPASIAEAGTLLAPRAAVTTVGCNHGENPTAIESHITAIDRYQGHPNVEVAGAPVEGRSGGGLFNAEGQLIGVCFAADPESNEGLYASLPSIIQKLESLGLSMVTQTSNAVAQQTPATPQIASVPDPSFAVRGQEPMAHSPSIESPFTQVAASPAAVSLSPSEQATFEEIQRRSENSEVICIVRPKTPGGKSEVISLGNASPQFVRSLVELAAARDELR